MEQVYIQSATEISETVKLYRLKALSGYFSFFPGQFISFLISQSDISRPAVRAYSFCSVPGDLPEFELCVRQVEDGVGTMFLQNNIGEAVECSSAQGDFLVPDYADEHLYIASGVGIAPIRSQIQAGVKTKPYAKKVLIYRHRPDEILFREEFVDLERENSNFKFIPIEIGSYDDIVHEVIQDHYPLSRVSAAMIAGPPEFVKWNTEVLEEKGYDKKNILHDIWEA